MVQFYFFSAIVMLTAFLSYLNTRFLKLPSSIGVMMLSTVFSFLLIGVNLARPDALSSLTSEINKLDFSKVVFDVMLCFLLFAGAMHTDYAQLRQNRKSIVLFSFVSVLLSTFLVGGIIYFLSALFGEPMNFLYALLFGALISPTDPIAVLGILTKANVPKTDEINIVGESLFNDGIGVVVFVSLLSILDNGIASVRATDILVLFCREAIGGVALGLAVGYVIFILLKSIDDYETEVIITLAGVMAGNWLAHSLHVSGPLAMVVAGLMTGHKARREAMSSATEMYVDKFWHLLDGLLNAVLFVLMGLKVISIRYEHQFLFIALCAIPLLIVARYAALIIPYSVARRLLAIDQKTIQLMTWGGLRGGLSIAMALSLSDQIPVRDELIFVTYVVVFFSIFVQGLTIERFAKKIYPGTGNYLP